MYKEIDKQNEKGKNRNHKNIPSQYEKWMKKNIITFQFFPSIQKIYSGIHNPSFVIREKLLFAKSTLFQKSNSKGTEKIIHLKLNLCDVLSDNENLFGGLGGWWYESFFCAFVLCANDERCAFYDSAKSSPKYQTATG